jgi:hypothetical protein
MVTASGLVSTAARHDTAVRASLARRDDDQPLPSVSRPRVGARHCALAQQAGLRRKRRRDDFRKSPLQRKHKVSLPRRHPQIMSVGISRTVTEGDW